MKSFFCLMSILVLCACTQSNQQHGNSDAARSQIIDSAVDACNGQRLQKAITYYQAHQCIIDAQERINGDLYLDKAAFNSYRAKRLLIALKVEKKQLSKDEANLMVDDIYNQMIAAEQKTWDAAMHQNAATQQRKNAAWAVGLHSLGTSMQQQYTPPQQINCGTVYNAVGASTTCQ